MQAVLIGVVLDVVLIIMILLLFSLVRRIDLLSYQLKDALRRLDTLERKKELPDGPISRHELAVKKPSTTRSE